ncbi:MAG TPA: cupin domain-containing protein [Thermomicrobiales bacterium]
MATTRCCAGACRRASPRPRRIATARRTSTFIRGQLRFWVAGEEIVATDGELVRTPPGIWHTLQVESDEAEFLTIFSPAGMEGFFRTLGRPAETMEFSPPGTTPQDMDKLLT